MEYQIIKIDEARAKEVGSLKEFVIEDVEINSDLEYQNLCELVKKVKGKEKEIKDFFKEPKSEAYENHKNISRLEKEMLEKLSNFETLAKKKIGDYQLKLEEMNTAENPITAVKVKGISSKDVWKYEVTNIDLLPPKYLKIEVNAELLELTIKQCDGSIDIPGIRIYKEKSVSVKNG